MLKPWLQLSLQAPAADGSGLFFFLILFKSAAPGECREKRLIRSTYMVPANACLKLPGSQRDSRQVAKVF